MESGAPEVSGRADASATLDDPSVKVWSVYLSEAALHDKALVESWTRDMDGILIFAGLFSAIVTAMIVESYTNLMPDPNDRIAALLLQISMQLGGNTSVITNPIIDSFHPTPSALRVNIFWFLSLCLGLTCALAATLVQQWARNYLQAIEKRPAPQVKARIRSYLYQGMDEFGMSAVVEGIPALLHGSVFLFLVGLVDFLYSINFAVALVTMCAVVTGFTLYATITWLPIINRKCPYRTPLSEVFWRFSQFLGLLRFRDRGVWKRVKGQMWEGQEALACADLVSRNRRDLQALSWTLESITDDGELASFAEGIPAFCSYENGRDTMRRIAAVDDLQLVPRITALQAENCAAARSIICMDAISAICALYSDDPWTFLRQYEYDLHNVIMPATVSSDDKVANAALNVAREVSKRIHSCILLHADRAQAHTAEAARLRSVMIAHSIMEYDEPEFQWGLIMLKRWNYLMPVIHMLPQLSPSRWEPGITPSSVVEDTKSVFLCPQFVDTLFNYFRVTRLFRILEECSHDDVDFLNDETHLECALACLKACFYMVEMLEWTMYLRTTGINLLASLTNSTSDAVSKYAICVIARFAAELQRRFYLSRDYSVLNNIMFFCANTPDRHFHPIPTPEDGAVPETMLHDLEMSDSRMTQLYEKLPLEERLDLQLIHGDGGKALALCRGQVAIFIRLLERLGNSYSSSIDALKLAYDSIKPMESYLNGRYSCRGDQSRLVQLCLDYTHRDTLDRLQPQRFCMDEILLRVLGTVGDPEIIPKAKEAIRTYIIATNGKYRLAAEMAHAHLREAIPLPAMDDYEIERLDPLLERKRSVSLASEAFDDSGHVLWHAVAASLGRIGIENCTELDRK